MATMTATEARNNISRLWEVSAIEPVTVESAGKPIAVVMSPAQFQKLSGTRKPRQIGFAQHLLKDIDVDALVSTSIDEVFAEYLKADECDI